METLFLSNQGNQREPVKSSSVWNCIVTRNINSAKVQLGKCFNTNGMCCSVEAAAFLIGNLL